MFLLIFELIFGDDTLEQLGNLKTDIYYVPAILTLAVVSATMQSVAIRLTTERENGILKRGRGTPMPPWVFFAGRIGNALVISLLMLIIVPAIGRLLYGVSIPWEHLPAVLVTLAIGAASFCALGVALTAIIPSEEAAPAITNVVIFPLYFLSGVLIPQTEIPDAVLNVADIFPIRHFFEAFFAALEPADGGRRLRVGPARGGRRLGRGRPRRRDPLLPLDAPGRLDPGALGRVRSVIHHVSLDVSDLESSGRFYDSVLGSLGWRRHLDDDEVIAWGIVRPVFFAFARGGRRRRAPGTCASRRAASRPSRRHGRAASAPGASTTGRPGPGPSTVGTTTRPIFSTRIGTGSRSPCRATENRLARESGWRR